MSKKLLLVLFWVFPFIVFSQQAKIDSLRQELAKASTDSLKLEAYHAIITFFNSNNLNNAEKYCDSLLQFANKTNFDKAKINFYVLKANLLFKQYKFKEAKNTYLNGLNHPKTDSFRYLKSSILSNVAMAYKMLDKKDSFEFYIKKGLILDKKTDNNIGLMTKYYSLADYYSTERDFQNANKYINKLMFFALKTNNKNFIARAHILFAKISGQEYDFENAAKNFQKSISIYQEFFPENIILIRALNYELSKIYVLAGFHGKAEKRLEKIRKEEMSSPINNSFIKAINILLLQCYTRESKKEKAQEIYTAVKNTSMPKSKAQQTQYYLSQAAFEVKFNHITSNTKTKIKNAIKISSKRNKKESLSIGYKIFSDYYKEQKEFYQAYYYLDLNRKIEDSLNLAENKIINLSYERKFNAEKKEKENLALKKQNAEQQLAVQRATILNQRYGILAAMVVLGLIGFIYHSKNRRHKLRDEHIINLARTKQKEHEKIGADLHATKAKELEKIAIALEEKGDMKLALKTREVKDSIRLLSHELFQIPFSQEEFDDQVLNLLFEYNTASLKINHQGIQSINWSKVDNTIKKNLYLIINEAISNIKNHSGATEATVKFQKSKKKINVTITDNGKGFTEDDFKKGHGFSNMNMRVSEINGSIRFESVKNKGSEIGIFITVF